MLEQATAKLSSHKNVTLTEGSVLDMSQFDNESFDVVIMTQVLHHLAPETHLTALKEISRVLQKGGIFWMSTCTPAQAQSGFWFALLIPYACNKCAARYTSIPQFEL